MNEMVKLGSSPPEFLEIVHRPSNRTVGYACFYCGKTFDAADEGLPIAAGHILSHVMVCEKNPRRPG